VDCAKSAYVATAFSALLERLNASPVLGSVTDIYGRYISDNLHKVIHVYYLLSLLESINAILPGC
jgi:hypothetical protein